MQCYARMLMAAGENEEAERRFREMLRVADNLSRPRMTARARCFLAEILRQRGHLEEAASLLDQAWVFHRTSSMRGDLADQSLPLKAKLGTPEKARQALEEAETTQRRFGNCLGLCRVLCLQARIFGGTDHVAEIRQLVAELPVLQNCPLASRILECWADWSSGVEDPTLADYWGL